MGGEFSDQINKILVLEDGYLAAGAYRGYPPSPGHQVDGWILRLDVDGDTLWTRRYDYVENGFSFFNDLIQVENGHYVAVGWASPPQTFDNLWMAKITQDGEVIWSHTFGGAGIDNAWAAAQAQDGGYVASGNTSSFGVGGFDMWLIKVSQNGDSLWSRTFGFGGSEEARAIALAPDGGFFLGGYSSSLSATYDDAWIVRTDSMGNYMWDKDLAGEFALGFEALVALDDGGVVAAGGDNPGSGGTALYMAKVDSSGDSVWARSWFQDWTSYGRDLKQLADGSFVSVGGVGSHGDPAHQTGDMWFIRLSPDMSPVSPTGPLLPSNLALVAYPNPFNSTLSISLDVPLHQEVTLSLYDLLGREVDVVYRGRVSSSTISYVAPAALSSGVYFLRASAGEQAVLRKVVLLK